MTHHDHGKQHDKHRHGHEHHSGRKNPPLHKNWMTWVAVLLMVGAILMYVLSDDEALEPVGPEGERMPAEAAP